MSSQRKQTAYSPLVGPVATPENVVPYGSRPAAAPQVTAALLRRGQGRYRIYCAPCHGETGDGDGVIVQRGFPRPLSFSDEGVRMTAPDQIYAAIVEGVGRMYDFAARIPKEDDRWAIVAYVKALQRRTQSAAKAGAK